VARSLLRVGAQPVIFYRRTRDEMPALREEVEKAEQEGVRFEFLTQRWAEEVAKGRPDMLPDGVGALDDSGRPRPVRVEGSEHVVQCDTVVKAIVERPDYSFLPTGSLDEQADSEWTRPVIRWAGCLRWRRLRHRPPRSPRRCARTDCGPVHTGLSLGTAPEEDYEPVCTIGESFDGSCLEPSTRVEVPERSLTERLSGLEVEETNTLALEAAEVEAERCFNCGCVAVNSPILRRPCSTGARIRTSQRVVDAEEFFTVGSTRAHIWAPGRSSSRFRSQTARRCPVRLPQVRLRKSIDFPIVNCAATLTSDRGVVRAARICLNSVYGLPMRMTAAERYLLGKTVDEAVAEQAAHAAWRRRSPAQQSVQDPDSANPGQAGDTDLCGHRLGLRAYAAAVRPARAHRYGEVSGPR